MPRQAPKPAELRAGQGRARGCQRRVALVHARRMPRSTLLHFLSHGRGSIGPCQSPKASTSGGKPQSPPSCVQAKDERAAANGGWRWALVHARGMVRDIGLVLRIRSFQILILQARPLLW